MRVIRSAGQNVSPSDDGRLFDQAFTDGLFEEATITATGGNTITLSALYGIICGRDFTAEAQTISATLPDSDTATGYVYVEFDTSSEDIITIGTALAPFTPTYEDINTNGAVVQMVIAQYEASAVAVTSVTPTYMTATAGSVKAGSIATVEKSPAVANHSIGEFILYGGDLYEVTAAIAAGETLVVGTNIAAASIGEELSALNNGLMDTIGATLVDCGSISVASNYDTKTFTVDNPYGTALIYPLIAKVPNANWITCGVHDFSTTATQATITVMFRNFYGSAVTGTFSLLLIGLKQS